MKNPPFPEFKKWRAVQDASKEAAEYIPRATDRFCGATLYQSGRSFHGVCLGKHAHRGVAIALEGRKAAVESSVDGLMRGLFSLKLTRYIRETGEQLLFRAGELLDVGDGVYGHAAFFTYVIDEPADRLGLLAKLFIGESGLE